jgi:hypothetical protein
MCSTIGVAYPAYLRDKARRLRLDEHLSIDEIAVRLALPRTTIYYWIRGTPLGRTRRNVAHPGNRAMCAKYRHIRELAYSAGRGEFRALAADATFRDFVCLYIAEGYRRNRNVVSIANSDPAVIKLAARWIRHFSNRTLDCSVQFHADQDLHELTCFWARELGVDSTAIKLQRKSNSNGLASRKWRSRYGVLSVRVNDTAFRARLQGWIDSMKRQWLDSTAFGA